VGGSRSGFLSDGLVGCICLSGFGLMVSGLHFIAESGILSTLNSLYGVIVCMHIIMWVGTIAPRVQNCKLEMQTKAGCAFDRVGLI
jgi:hypothetical protein